ncbi:MAG TPA: iron transporter FeoB [Phycisphaeraceae bacterium]|nr:iron transporter FeoB [Phycisphaeraceae bacterium]
MKLKRRKSCRDCDQYIDPATDSGRAVVALAGNPNTGKSTVFNAITGLKQHTGNWPGKTVSRAEGTFIHQGKRYHLVDLPGTYSLLSASVDEQIARDFLLFGKPDCTIVVVDATALRRNLNLTLQVLQITEKVVVCCNLMDEARRRGIAVDTDRLSEELGVPVVPTAARRGIGIDLLLDTVAGVVAGEITPRPHVTPVPESIRRDVDELIPEIEALVPGIPNARWVALRLIEGDLRLQKALETGELAAVVTANRNMLRDSQTLEPVLLTIEGATDD